MLKECRIREYSLVTKLWRLSERTVGRKDRAAKLMVAEGGLNGLKTTKMGGRLEKELKNSEEYAGEEVKEEPKR
jgi:hypothetical protein